MNEDQKRVMRFLQDAIINVRIADHYDGLELRIYNRELDLYYYGPLPDVAFELLATSLKPWQPR